MEHVSLSEITRPVKKYWGLIVLCFFSVVLTVSIFTILATPIYQSKATVTFSEGTENQYELFNMTGILRQKYLIKNQVAVLKSRQLAGKVIEDLQNSDQRDSLIVLGGIPKDRPQMLKEQLFPWLKKNDDTIKKEYTRNRLIARFQKRTDVVSGRDTDLIELTGTSSSPWEAAFIVNRWVEVYKNYYYSRNIGHVSRQRKLLEIELGEYKNKLFESEKLLAAYQDKNKVFALDNETEQLIIQLANIESQYNETCIELNSVNDQMEFLKSELEETQKSFINGISQITNSNLRELLTSYSTELRERTALHAMLKGAGMDVENNEQLKQMQHRLDAILNKIHVEKSKLSESSIGQIDPFEYSNELLHKILELETSERSLIAKKKTQEGIIDDYNMKMSQLPYKSQQLARLERDVERNGRIYDMLSERFEEMRITEASEIGHIEVVDYAQPDLRAISPKMKINIILACFFGLVLGLAVAFTTDFFIFTVNNETKFNDIGVRLIGRIPCSEKFHAPVILSSHKEDHSRLRAKSIFKNLLIQKQPHASIEESYRTLRTAIYLKNREHPIQTILVTSPNPGEGKSTTSANIAISLAQQNVRTLLVDADIRRPILDFLFTGANRESGLLNALQGDIVWADAVRETSVNKLYLLPAGHNIDHGPELLSSIAMQRFINAARKKFRFIIFDSSPVLPVTDATILASLVDGIVLVMRNEKTTVQHVKRTIGLLDETKTQILGGVLTGVKHQDVYAGYKREYTYGTQEEDIIV